MFDKTQWQVVPKAGETSGSRPDLFVQSYSEMISKDIHVKLMYILYRLMQNVMQSLMQSTHVMVIMMGLW